MSGEAATKGGVTLDRVMLAMDVVDTLRHQQALVAAELDDDERQREFVARVQAIYESQGIEVSEDVVAEGVRALREDRFVYSPPGRSFQVALAGVYVERGKWALRAGIVALVGLAIWAAIAVPSYFKRQGIIGTFDEIVLQLEMRSAELTHRAADLEQELVRARARGGSTATERLLADAEDTLIGGTGEGGSLASVLPSVPDGEVYIEDRERWDVALDSYSGMAGQAGAAFGQVDGLLAQVEQLGGMRARLEAARQRVAEVPLSAGERAGIDAGVKSVEAALMTGDVHAAEAALVALDSRAGAALAARQREADTRAQFAALANALEGVDVETAAATELRGLRQSVEQAIAAGDWQRAGHQVGALRSMVSVLDRSYELRIVSRRNDRSGVWRHPDRDRSIRNYYIIVEAIDAAGKRLTLPIESEEDQSTRNVRKFGVRVPESVFEKVKADKLDNGLIDNTLFGTKRRGQREPEYHFQVAGGRITRW